MTSFSPLAAFDIIDLLRAMIPIVFLVIWVVVQVLGGREAAPQGQNRKNVPIPRPKGAPPQQKPAAGPVQADPLAQEIETFLRRAAEKRQGRVTAENRPSRAPAEKPPSPVLPEKPPRQRAADVEVRRDQPARQTIRTLVVPSEPAPARETVMRERSVPVLPSRDSVASHVKEYLSSDQFVTRTTQLGEEVGEADERMEARLHAKFDHQLGQLTKSSSESPYEVGSSQEIAQQRMLGVNLAELLRSPQGILQAIVLNEILQPPQHRW